MAKPKQKQINIRLSEDIDKRLSALARTTHRTKSFYVRQAVFEHMENLEDYYLAISRLEENQPTIAIDDVERELGLDD